MLFSSDAFPVRDGRVEGNLREGTSWPHMPAYPRLRLASLVLGDDPNSGTSISVFDYDPMEVPDGQPRPEHSGAPVHHHRSPSFRIALGEQQRQMFIDGGWYGPGEYFVMDANRKYYDPAGANGGKVILIVADRRGTPEVIKGETAPPAPAQAPDAPMHDLRRYPFVPHARDEDAVTGIALTVRAPERGGRARGSIDEPGWAALDDGSSVAGVFLEHAADGPVVILSRNAPGAVESPAGHCATDLFRHIVSGSCSIGGRTYTAGCFIAQEKGAPIDAVVHGPEGSVQLLLAADRRGWIPLDDEGHPHRAARLDQIAAALVPFATSPAV